MIKVLPANPLKEKWDELYPPTPRPEKGEMCDSISCLWCGRCPRGGTWKVPGEDACVWDSYLKKLNNFYRKYGEEYLFSIAL